MTSNIKKTSGWNGAVETITLPYTATKDGLIKVLIVPPKSGSVSYIYINEDGDAHVRGYSTSGSYTVIIPVTKGSTYTIGTSANINPNALYRFYPL